MLPSGVVIGEGSAATCHPLTILMYESGSVHNKLSLSHPSKSIQIHPDPSKILTVLQRYPWPHPTSSNLTYTHRYKNPHLFFNSGFQTAPSTKQGCSQCFDMNISWFHGFGVMNPFSYLPQNLVILYMDMDQIDTIFRGMNIHLPAILMFTSFRPHEFSGDECLPQLTQLRDDASGAGCWTWQRGDGALLAERQGIHG